MIGFAGMDAALTAFCLHFETCFPHRGLAEHGRLRNEAR